MIKIGNFLGFIFFSLFMSLSWAQGTVVVSKVDKSKLEVGDTVTMTVSVQSSESVDIDDPRLPQLSGLNLIQRWDNTAVQQSLVQTDKGMDFKTIRKREFHFMFEAMQPGRFSLDAFEVVVNGKLFKTEPIIVEVFPAGSAPQNPNQRQERTQEDEEEDFLQQQEEIFNQLLQRQFGGGGGLPFPSPSRPNRPGRPQVEPQFRSTPTNPNDAFFIQVEVDKTTVYEGEQVTATWYLMTRGQIETLDRVKFPALKGFWKEIIEENPQIQFFEEIVNGVPYRKALLASHALFPIKAGKAIIDEFTVKSRVRAGGTFGFNTGRAYEYTKSSKRVEITVKPLPTEGRPASFTGAVGQYEVKASVEGNQFPVSQPFTFKLRIEGQGNAKAIDLPGIQWPDNLELYDTKNESRFFKDGNSFKEFQVLLIPRKEGELEIPEVAFSFFNPVKNQYEEKKTELIKMKITPAVGGLAQGGSNTFLGSGKVAPAVTLALPALLESSSIFAKANDLNRLVGTGITSAASTQVWGLWWILVLGVSAGLGVLSYRELSPRSRVLSLRKKLDDHWKKVESALKSDDAKQVGAEIVNAFNLVLSEVTSHKGETQGIHRMLEQLDPERRGKFAASVLECYESAQLLGFAPISAVEAMKSGGKVSELVKKSKNVLNQLCE